MSEADHIDNKLVEYAYGELSPSQMRDAQTHLQTCPRCATALDEIRSVRRVMAQLPTVPAPTDGLDSLISYAQQRARVHAESQPLLGRWRWLVWPVAGAAACLALVVISTRVVKEMRPLSSEIASASRETPVKLPSVEPPESRDRSIVTLKSAPLPPPRSQKDNSAERETPFDRRYRSDDLKLKEAERVADASPETPNEVAMREKLDFIEQGSAVRKPSRRSASREEPHAGLFGAAATNENKPVVVPQASPTPPAQIMADDADRRIADKSGVSAKLSKKVRKTPEPDDGVEGGVAGGVVGGVIGGTAGRAPGSEEIGVSGQRIQRPSSPTSHYAQPPPKKAELQESSESLSREVTSVRQSLNQGAAGMERARLLNRLCELLFALGQELDAIAACDTVLKEFPNTQAAQSASTLKASFSKAGAGAATEKRDRVPSP